MGDLAPGGSNESGPVGGSLRLDRASVSLMLLPVGVLLVLCVMLLAPATKDLAIWLLAENHPIEMLSFVAAMWAAVEGAMLVRRLRGDYGLFVLGFLLLFALMMFFLAMEEIAWGQQLFKFSTPEFWRVQNAQEELTLHNYRWTGSTYLEIYPFLFAVGGLIGIFLRMARLLPWVICPAPRLWPWFAVVALHSGIDVFHEFYIVISAFDELINQLDEAAELLVAISGLLFLRLNRIEAIAREASHLS